MGVGRRAAVHVGPTWAAPAVLTTIVVAVCVFPVRSLVMRPEEDAEWLRPDLVGRSRPVGPHCANALAGPSTHNAIVVENCRAGTPSQQWEINGAGDPAVQGFATPTSASAGQQVEFKVKVATEPSLALGIDVFRLGYYQGHGARKVASLSAEIHEQPACLHDTNTGLHDCSAWQANAVWKVPTAAVSGVYFARFTLRGGDPLKRTWREDNSQVGDDPRFYIPGAPFARPEPTPQSFGASGRGRMRRPLVNPRASHAYFVVRADKRTTKAHILFQTADQTWQAYNDWAENATDYSSTYGSYPGWPRHRWNPRIVACSTRRPLRTRENRPLNTVFGAEYPTIRFLERNGFDVIYFSGLDTRNTDAEVLASKAHVFFSVGHDEYWTGQQRQNVEDARNKFGMHFSSLAGNQVFWRVRYEDSKVDGGKDATMVVYKETQSLTKIDPDKHEWTGTFRDDRPSNPVGPWPENSLSGLIYTVNAWRRDPLVVPWRYTSLRWWRHTEVAAKAAPGQAAVLHAGIIGHEFDEDVDNGFRPGGMIHLSETHVDNVMYIQDAGSVYDSGAGTHRMVLFRHPESGAVTFGAGTVQFGFGLDDTHDDVGSVNLLSNFLNSRLGTDLAGPEQSIAQLLVNVLQAQGGLRPTTPDAWLTVESDAEVAASNDTEPPSAWVAEVLPDSVVCKGTDTGGGVVAAVEVTVDAGKRWHPAWSLDRRSAQETTWTYTYDKLSGVHRPSNPSLVRCRAIDDSLNMQPDHQPKHTEL
eukprot:m.236546 g.236546  ORF g.236546 m.236546 type:complete len:755 (+) comp18941_c0_seq3:129-2393(+)